MKYSGVEWIGNVPDSWEIRKVKQCFYISKETANQNNPTVLSLARSGVKVRDISNNEGQLAASYDNYNVVKSGDLLLNPMDLYSGANCSLSDVNGVISPAYINLRSKVELNPKYFDYYFKTQYWLMAMFAHGKGVSFDNRWTINSDSILNYRLPWPSSSSQNLITSFICEKVELIDHLIKIEKKQIELINEYKEIFLKEKVNDHSTLLIKFKYLLDIESGNVIDSDSLNQSGDYEVYGGGSLIGFSNKTNCKQGSIIIGRVGANCGCVRLANNDCWATDNALIVSPKIDAEYLELLLKAASLNETNNSSAQPLVTGGKIKSTSTKYESSLGLQKSFITNVKKEFETFDALITIKMAKIEKLEEYKKSFIFEYVTGKKEVNA